MNAREQKNTVVPDLRVGVSHCVQAFSGSEVSTTCCCSFSSYLSEQGGAEGDRLVRRHRPTQPIDNGEQH